MQYISSINTFFQPVKEEDSWEDKLKEAINITGRKLSQAAVTGPLPTSTPTAPQSEEIPAATLKHFQEQGLEITPEVRAALIKINEENRTETRDAVVMKVPEGVLSCYAGYMDHPTKKTITNRSIKSTPQVFKIRLNKNSVEEGADRNYPLLPADGTTYKLFISYVGDHVYYARKTERTTSGTLPFRTVCEAWYNRFPKDKATYGTPKQTPEWLEDPTTGCKGCLFGPHRDRTKDKERGIAYEDACKFSRLFPTFLAVELPEAEEDSAPTGYEGQKGWIGPLLWEPSGQLDTFLQKDTTIGKRPHYHYIYGLKNIKMTEKGNKKRTLEDDTDKEQGVFVDRKSTDPEQQELFFNVSTISGAMRAFYKERLKPIEGTVTVSQPKPVEELTPDDDDNDADMSDI